MGTSTRYKGPSNGLVPTWLDEPAPAAPPPQPIPPDGGQQGAPDPAAPNRPQPVPAPQRMLLGAPGSFTQARANFTKFAKTASAAALGKALSHYVRHGTVGAGRAAQRMGASRNAGAQLLGVVRDFRTDGVAETLNRLNLSNFEGRPAADVFLAIVEFVCPPGGAIDEAIARQAMLESIEMLAEADLGPIETLAPEVLTELFLDFVTRSIEGRILADVGNRGITLPTDVQAVERAQVQLHQFIEANTRAQLNDQLANIQGLNDQQLQGVVNEIYSTAFDLLLAAAEEEQ